MNQKRVLLQATVMTLSLLLSVGCGISQVVPTPLPPTPTSIPTPSATPLPPTAVPTPTPASIPGIDEPIIVENISVQDSFGLTATGDLEMKIIDAYTQESLEGGDTGPIYPGDTSNLFLTLLLELDGPSNSVNWVGLNGALVCGGVEYKAERTGLKVGEGGILAGWLLIYTLPGDTDFGGCTLQLPDEQEIPLASFFE